MTARRPAATGSAAPDARASRGRALRERPCVGSNFAVRFDDGGGGIEGGFSEVLFPDFVVQATRRAAGSRAAPAQASAPPDAPGSNLVLRRAVFGSLDLYRWFDQARTARRGGPAVRRTVIVELLAEDHATVVLAWRFTGARPVRLAYSPLRALASELVVETLELAFDRVDME